MKVIEHILKSTDPLLSFEIVPPPRGRSIGDVIEVVNELEPFRPAWIDVTSHSSTAYFRELEDGTLERKTFRKRPGTMGICGIIQNRFRIDTVAHVLCLGFSREETEDALIELSYLGIENILALRGDAPNFQKELRRDRTLNTRALDLVEQLSDLRAGKFLNDIENTDQVNFCVGVAGYPEKHFEAPNLKTDISYLKKKVEAGADYIVTQMFFDNKKYFDFVKACREADIQVPIIPGIKVISSLSQLKSLPKTFHIDIPEALSDEMLANPENCKEIGKNWARKQAEGLLAGRVPSLHFYVLNDVALVSEIVKGLF